MFLSIMAEPTWSPWIFQWIQDQIPTGTCHAKFDQHCVCQKLDINKNVNFKTPKKDKKERCKEAM